ncbi:MAG: efflux RND transporter permease subunit [Duodenibacillus sp.]|nr:efflux RND transporter permease subunit [Duodenibacillus sp.]
MLSQFCIRRPIFATVLSLLILIAGFVAYSVLPVSQYPNITPPRVTVFTTYEGANTATLARTVAAPLEDQLSGVEGLLYYTTNIRANGDVRIQCTFDVDVDPNDATLEINNRVRTAERLLPEKVRQNGINVRKRSEETLLLLALTSPDGSYKTSDLADYALLHIVDYLKRLPGIGDVSIFGNVQSAMRIWLDPQRMGQLGVTTSDVERAILDKNAQRGAGKVGAPPVTAGQQVFYTTTSRGQLLTPEEFGDVIVRVDNEGNMIRIRDFSRTELGKRSYESSNEFNGKPSVTIAVYLQTGANAMAAAKAVKAELERIRTNYPEGKVDHQITDDTTVFVSASLNEVYKTLAEAGLLVLIVVFLFLQNLRATIIPMLAVPVSLIGTMAGLWAFGFSLNTMTLFAMTLSIGIVVDDAIVVLENVERLMRTEKVSAFRAAQLAMNEVAGALVAIVLVLSAVFIPVAFLGGIAGELYRQFAVTIAVSVALSGFIALTLTPALCAVMLKKHVGKPNPFFQGFNRALEALTDGYIACVKLALRYRAATAVLLVATMIGCWQLIQHTPTSFVPREDQGILRLSTNLPDGASMNRTEAETTRLRELIEKEVPGVASILVMNGRDAQGGDVRSNAATFIMRLKHWDEREQTAFQLQEVLRQTVSAGTDSVSVPSLPPAIRGLGSANGFSGYILAQGNDDPLLLQYVTESYLQALRERPELTGLRSFIRAESPVLEVNVNEEKAMRLGVMTADVYDTLGTFFAGTYINDFTRNGRIFRVIMQADDQYRMTPEHLDKCFVRSSSGTMIPLGSLLEIKRISGPESLERMNGYLASQFAGAAQHGVSSGEAIRIAEEIAAEVLPEGYDIAWTGQAWHEKRIGASSSSAFGFGLLIVFLILAALYERWSLPIAVVLAIPYALLGALLSLWMRNSPNDIYFQIGLLVLIGLTAKNAILIVEFAIQKLEEGFELYDAAIEAARLRLRPILMTSLAFVLGVLPLVFATGPGANARQSMGTGVCGGMIFATFIATIFVPVFFTWFVSRNGRSRNAPTTTDKGVQANE